MYTMQPDSESMCIMKRQPLVQQEFKTAELHSVCTVSQQMLQALHVGLSTVQLPGNQGDCMNRCPIEQTSAAEPSMF